MSIRLTRETRQGWLEAAEPRHAGAVWPKLVPICRYLSSKCRVEPTAGLDVGRRADGEKFVVEARHLLFTKVVAG
jgi:hypothetical protein